jgi:hypothetical protein
MPNHKNLNLKIKQQQQKHVLKKQNLEQKRPRRAKLSIVEHSSTRNHSSFNSPHSLIEWLAYFILLEFIFLAFFFREIRAESNLSLLNTRANITPKDTSFQCSRELTLQVISTIFSHHQPVKRIQPLIPNVKTKAHKSANSSTSKTVTVETIAERVCHDIHAAHYVIFNNPDDSSFSINEKGKLSVSMPKHIEPIAVGLFMEEFRSVINELMADDWQDISIKMEQEQYPVLRQLRYDYRSRLQIEEYMDALKNLHSLRVQSAGFLTLGGGTCGELSVHVTYSMLRAYHFEKMTLPSIAQMGLKDPKKYSHDISHGISVVGVAPRKRGERFFDPSNPEHAKGSVCDPWLHQVASFTPMNKITEHALLSPDNIPYIVRVVTEVGQFPDISTIPEELQTSLKKWYHHFIENPYVIPDGAKKTIQMLRESLDLNAAAMCPSPSIRL